MADLFSEDPQFKRAQYIKLSDNVREWAQEISALVSERLPRDLGLDVQVIFQKTDDQKGYAIGTAVATLPQTGKSVGIPIVVKAWHLAPLDMFFQEEKLYPMNERTFSRAFYSADLGAGVAPRRPPPSLQDDSGFETRYPPMGGKYASVFEALHGTCRAEDINAFREAVQSQPAVLAKFAKQHSFQRIQKWAAEKPSEKPQDKVDKERAVKVLTIKKEGPNSYMVFGNSDNVYNPILLRTDRRQLQDLIKTFSVGFCDHVGDPMHNVDKIGEYTIVLPKSPYGEKVEGATGQFVMREHRNPFVFNPLQDTREIVPADKLGRYGVRDKSGVLVKGWVLPDVVGFDGKSVGIKIFVSPVLASIQNRIMGIKLQDEPNITMPVDTKMETGKSGVLVYQEGDKLMATIPFEVVNTVVFRGQRSYGVVDHKGNRYNLIPSSTANSIVEIKPSEMLGPLVGPGKNYLLPPKMGFVRFSRMASVSETKDDFQKIASERGLDVHPLKVSTANGKYIFRGGHIGKYANLTEPKRFDFSSLPRHEASFLLGSWGLDTEKIAEVLDETKNHIVLEVHHLHYTEPFQGNVKIASEKLKQWVRSVKPNMNDLVKSAAMLEDSDEVDTVLGLGFVNDENINRFASVKPMLEEVSGLLAKLLLSSRLGVEEIPEESVRNCLQHLQRVIDGLEELDVRKVQEKTSGVQAAVAAC